MVDIF